MRTPARGAVAGLAWILAVAFGLVVVFASPSRAGGDAATPVVATQQDLMQGGAVTTTANTVEFETDLRPGSIVIEADERLLYFVLGEGKAIRYLIGVGREGFGWTGVERVSRKAEWPSWRPPAAMRKRNPFVPVYLEGGPGNPLGVRALYLGSTLYRIHGTNDGGSVGRASSSGCFRMLNEDVIDLYERTKIGATVVVR